MPVAVPCHVDVVPALFERKPELLEGLVPVAVLDLAVNRNVHSAGVRSANLDGADVRVEEEPSARRHLERLGDDVFFACVSDGGEGQGGRHEDRYPKHRGFRIHGLLHSGRSRGFTPVSLSDEGRDEKVPSLDGPCPTPEGGVEWRRDEESADGACLTPRPRPGVLRFDAGAKEEGEREGPPISI